MSDGICKYSSHVVCRDIESHLKVSIASNNDYLFAHVSSCWNMKCVIVTMIKHGSTSFTIINWIRKRWHPIRKSERIKQAEKSTDQLNKKEKDCFSRRTTTTTTDTDSTNIIVLVILISTCLLCVCGCRFRLKAIWFIHYIVRRSTEEYVYVWTRAMLMISVCTVNQEDRLKSYHSISRTKHERKLINQMWSQEYYEHIHNHRSSCRCTINNVSAIRITFDYL